MFVDKTDGVVKDTASINRNIELANIVIAESRKLIMVCLLSGILFSFICYNSFQ